VAAAAAFCCSLSELSSFFLPPQAVAASITKHSTAAITLLFIDHSSFFPSVSILQQIRRSGFSA
jgi:hypothetical protein